MCGIGNFIGWLIVGALAGWLASKVMGTDEEQGCMGDLFVGIVGGFIGGFIFSVLGLRKDDTGFIISLITAFVGAVIFLALLRKYRSYAKR